MAAEAIQIDGSTLEGGGQLLRNSIAFSALLSQPISIYNVRHNRRPPGLRAQHAAGLTLVKKITSADAPGIGPGAVKFDFNPGPIKHGSYLADPRTAGSVTLLFQISLPCLLFPHSLRSDRPTSTVARTKLDSAVQSTLILKGGTNAIAAPQIDYAQHVFLPFIHEHFQIPQISLNVVRRGYYPKGGGQVEITIPALTQPLPALTLLERGDIELIHGIAHSNGPLPAHVVEEMRDAAFATLERGSEITSLPAHQIRIKTSHDTLGFGGSGIVLWAKTSTGCLIGASAVGEKGKQARKVGTQAAEDLLANLKHGGCVDEHLQDQIIIFMSLAEGRSTVRAGPLSLHTRTAIWVAETLTDAKFEIENVNDDQTLISCTGIGLGKAAPSEEEKSLEFPSNALN